MLDYFNSTIMTTDPNKSDDKERSHNRILGKNFNAFKDSSRQAAQQSTFNNIPSIIAKSPTPIPEAKAGNSGNCSHSEPKNEGEIPQVPIDGALYDIRYQFFLDYQQKSKNNDSLRYAEVRNEVFRSWMFKTLGVFDHKLRFLSELAAQKLTNGTIQGQVDSKSSISVNRAANLRDINQIKKGSNKAVLKALEALRKDREPANTPTLSPALFSRTNTFSSLENQKQFLLIELWAVNVLRSLLGSGSLLSSRARCHVYRDYNLAASSKVAKKPQICMLYTQTPFGLIRKPSANDLNLSWSWQLAYDEPECHVNSVNICDSMGVAVRPKPGSHNGAQFQNTLHEAHLGNFACYTTPSYSILPLPDNSQRSLTILDAYIRISSSDLPRTVKEAHRVLEPDGMIEVMMYDLPAMSRQGDSEYDRERNYLYNCMLEGAKDIGIDLDYRDSLARMLPQIGFYDVKYSVIAFPGISSLPLAADTQPERSSLSTTVEYAGHSDEMDMSNTKTLTGQNAEGDQFRVGYKENSLNGLCELYHNYCEFVLMYGFLNLDGSGLEEKLQRNEISLPEYVKLIDQARRYISFKCKERNSKGSSNLQAAASIPRNNDRNSINAVIDSILPSRPTASNKRNKKPQRTTKNDGMQYIYVVSAKKRVV